MQQTSLTHRTYCTISILAILANQALDLTSLSLVLVALQVLGAARRRVVLRMRHRSIPHCVEPNIIHQVLALCWFFSFRTCANVMTHSFQNVLNVLRSPYGPFHLLDLISSSFFSLLLSLLVHNVSIHHSSIVE